MWDQLTLLAADPSVAVLAQQDGWESVKGTIDTVRENLLIVGGGLLTVFGAILVVKIAGSGKGKMRERIGDVGIWVFAGIFAGLVTFVPGIMTSLGRETVQNGGTGGTGGGGAAVVDGQ